MTLQQTATATEMTDAIGALAATLAGTMRENIQRAKTDLQSSTDLTLANAKRVDEIKAMLATRRRADAETVKQTIQAESFPQPRSGYVDGQR